MRLKIENGLAWQVLGKSGRAETKLEDSLR